MIRQVLAALLLLVAGPAQAVVVDVVVRGTVRTLTDMSSGGLNVFGGDLAVGVAYTARYTYDTSLGARSTGTAMVPADSLTGSSDDAFGNPVHATLTIGQTRHNLLDGATLPDIRASGVALLVPALPDPVFPPDGGIGSDPRPNLATYGAFYQAYDESFNRSQYGELRFSFAGALGTFPGSLETPFTVGFRENPQNQSRFPTGFGSWITGYQDRAAGTNGFLTADFRVDRLTVRPQPGLTPVPLPDSAWLLAAALCGLGLMATRRRTFQVFV